MIPASKMDPHIANLDGEFVNIVDHATRIISSSTSSIIRHVCDGNMDALNDAIDNVGGTFMDTQCVASMIIAIINDRLDVVELFYERFSAIKTAKMMFLAVKCNNARIAAYLADTGTYNGSADCSYYAVIADNEDIINVLLQYDTPLLEYHVNDFKQRQTSPRILRNFVRAGGWLEGMVPGDYAAEITRERHNHYPTLAEYMRKKDMRVYSDELIDINVVCIE